MTQDNPSLEDLLPASRVTTPADGQGEDKIAAVDEGAAAALSAKMAEIERQNKEKETEGQAAALGMPFMELKSATIDREALPFLTRPEMAELKLAAFLYQPGELRLATTSPSESVNKKVRELAALHHARAALYLISEASFNVALAEYDKLPKKAVLRQEVSITAADLEKFKDDVQDLKNLPDKLRDLPLTDVFTIILAAAVKSESSDIHIEAEAGGIKLRFRLDGILHEMAELAPEVWPQVIARIKLLSRLKINITDKPQDGRISIELPNDKLDIRVSTLPTAFGESVVMRLLRSSSVGLKFEDLGLRGKAYEDLKREIERPNGMILTTGPTGSGKTTTLYAILNKLNNEETKIITLEDPVEYKLAGINQSQVDPSRDYTFVKGLRSILRQDPDVVMVGEIRDLETADVAINAALTGHLVLSTLHTHDAAGAIPRFLAMGVKAFLMAPAINAVIGQRLVRKICQQCKKEAQLPPELAERAGKVLEQIPKNSGHNVPALAAAKFYEGGKCEQCHQTGFKGRVGIYEIFTMTPEIEKMIQAGNAAEADIRVAAQAAGMITMVQDGILKALDGITSVEEVFRVAE